jgi:hypothetical protein
MENKEINELLDETILQLNKYREIVNEYNEETLQTKYCYYFYQYRILQIENIKLHLNIDLNHFKIIDSALAPLKGGIDN